MVALNLSVTFNFTAGLEIATDMVANSTKIFSLATKNFWFSHHFGNQVSLWFRFKLKD